MAAITDVDVYEEGPNAEVKVIYVQTRNTADAADTIDIDMAAYGGKDLLYVGGVKHTTDGSVVAIENPATSVSGTTLTLTIPAGTDNDTRVYRVVMSSKDLTFS